MWKILSLDDSKEDRVKLSEFIHEALDNKFEYQLDLLGDSMSPLIDSNSYDIYFLDIDMPNQDGISVAKRIKKTNAQAILIFVTNHDNLVFKSFEVNPFQFVRKTAFSHDFDICIKSLQRKMQESKRIYSFLYNNVMTTLKYEDILYFEKFKNYLYVYTVDGYYQYRENLSFVEMQINHPDFVRSHTSYLVNMAHVKQMGEDIILMNERRIPISRLKTKETKEKYMQYVKEKA